MPFYKLYRSSASSILFCMILEFGCIMTTLLCLRSGKHFETCPASGFLLCTSYLWEGNDPSFLSKRPSQGFIQYWSQAQFLQFISLHPSCFCSDAYDQSGLQEVQLEDGSTAYIQHTVHMPQSNTILAIQADGTIADLQTEAAAIDPETISVLEQYTTKVNILCCCTGVVWHQFVQLITWNMISIKNWKKSFLLLMFVFWFTCVKVLIFSLSWNDLLMLYWTD